MRQANLESTAYDLRHTYAQKLLESNCSIFKIKEMLGHDNIETTKVYLSIHIQLMREVILKGHVHVTDTYWYLTAIPELLGLTKDRLEKRWEDLS